MTSQHPRIGLTRDPELASAVESTRGLLDPAETRSEAGHVRRLALLGAQALRRGLGEGEGARDRKLILNRSGVRPATRTLEELPWLATESADRRRQASQALAWARGDR